MDGRVFSYRDEAHNRSDLHDWERAAIERHFPSGGHAVAVAEPARG
jgi:hypothetical protein